MMKKLLSIGALVSLFGLAGLGGCEERTPTEKALDDAGEKIEDAADKAGDAAEDAADKAGDALEDAGDKVKDATGG
jgi:hypothetical protein